MEQYNKELLKEMLEKKENNIVIELKGKQRVRFDEYKRNKEKYGTTFENIFIKEKIEIKHDYPTASKYIDREVKDVFKDYLYKYFYDQAEKGFVKNPVKHASGAVDLHMELYNEADAKEIVKELLNR